MAAASMALAHDALLPRAPGGLAPGAALALLVHAALIAALTVSVDWRTQTPEIVSAELWAAVPQSAAPRPVEPAPPPPAPVPVEARPVAPAPTPAPAPSPPVKLPEPDIALEKRKVEQAQKKAAAEAEAKAEKAKAEQARVEKAKAAEKTAADKEAAEAKAEEARLAKQREENLKRMMGQAGNANGRSGSATQEAAPSASYAGAVAARIRRELVFPGNVPETAEAEVLVRAATSGTIIARQLTKSSGYKDWDDAVLRAIDKTGSLPRDSDGRVPTAMTLVFRRKE